MNSETFLNSFGHVADAPGGIDRIRSLVLDLAVRGKLTAPGPVHASARELLTSLAESVPAGARGGRRRAKDVGHHNLAAETPFDIPESWEWASLGQISSDIHYGLTAKASPTAGGPAFVRITDIKRGAIQWDGVPGCAEPEVDPERFLLKIGDILVARSGSVGVSTVVRDLPRQAVFASYLIRIIPSERWLSSWWPVVAGSGMYWRQVEQSTTGSAQKNINSTNMRRWSIPVPPEADQVRIVERVAELMYLCDRLETQQTERAGARSALTASTLNRISEIDSVDDLRPAVRAFVDNVGLHLAPGEGDLVALNRVRGAILELAVRGRLTNQDSADEPATALIERIASERARLVGSRSVRQPQQPARLNPDARSFEAPAGWIWCALDELLVSNEAGWSPVCPAEPRSSLEQWGVLKLSAVSWGQFLPHEHKVLAAGLAPRPAIEVRDGDFLMSRANTAALVGRSVVVTAPPPRLMMSDLVVRLGFVDRVTAEYVNILNGTRAVRALYATVSKGTSDTMRKLSRGQILATPVPLPPLDEQRRIVRRVAELSALCNDLESLFTAASVLRSDVAASVAAHAVSGNSKPDKRH